ncbi:MAG: hypothetical protein WDZ52_08365 [Pseudohongiellaceae bacterium]
MTQSPRTLINFAVLGVAFLAFLIFSVMRYAPYTGFMLGYDDELDELRVVNLDGWVETQGLQLGDTIESITNADGLRMTIERRHILKSSAEARQYYGNRSQRLIEIDRLYELFNHSPIVISRGDGTEVTLVLDRQRPISSLSLSFWALFFISLTAPLVSSIVWAWQPKKPEASLLLISGLGFFASCFSSVASIYNTDMFYIPLFLHWLIRCALDLGQFTFAVFGTAVLLYYPNRLSFAPKALKALLAGYFIYPPLRLVQWLVVQRLRLRHLPGVQRCRSL